MHGDRAYGADCGKVARTCLDYAEGVVTARSSHTTRFESCIEIHMQHFKDKLIRTVLDIVHQSQKDRLSISVL